MLAKKRCVRPKQVPPRRILCPHCNQLLTAKTFNNHKRWYYTESRGWIVDTDSSTSDSDCDIPECDLPPQLPTPAQFVVRASVPMEEELVQEDQAEPCFSAAEDSSELDSDFTSSSGDEFWLEGSGEDSESSDTDELPPVVVTPVNDNEREGSALVKWIVIFLVKLKARNNISERGMDILIKFLYTFLLVLSRFCTYAAAMLLWMPRSLYKLKQFLPNYEPQFVKYVVCRKCTKLYKHRECILSTGTSESSKHCENIRYPDHPFISRRKECGCVLVKSVKTHTGKQFFYPYKMFCYRGIKASLQELLLRPGFVDKCQKWCHRVGSEGTLSDIYDGKVWHEFFVETESPFYLDRFSIGFMLNIDWFQPYKHTVYSVGAVYLSIMNLPRSLRYQRQNVLLVSMIPGPSEPEHDINAYLGPLVDELKLFWDGVVMKVANGGSEIVRCALLCCACDLPAGRKVCGFLGHAASLGCSRCLKQFPGGVGELNCGGFDRAAWPSRSNSDHRQRVDIVLAKSKTKTGQADTESQQGCRYSALLELPYFDPVRMLIIDPMHNLLLGTGKRMINVWISNGLISKPDFKSIQSIVDSFTCPPDVGRIPHKIASSFSGFTADQCKNWINIFSIPALYNILPSTHIECWRHFVLACRVLCKHKLTLLEISLADGLLLQFCRRFERLYGAEEVTPNMHLHCHLKECILDYGPVYQFWLFSYERYNGILARQPNNNKLPEPQMMSQFLRDNTATSVSYPEEFRQDFEHLCSTLSGDRLVGSVADTLLGDDCTNEPKMTKYKLSTLDQHVRVEIQQLLCNLQSLSAPIVNRVIKKFTSIECNGKPLTTQTGQPCIAFALWDPILLGAPSSALQTSRPNAHHRPVMIHYFAYITYSVGESTDTIVLANVSWHFPHTSRYGLGQPAEIWCKSTFEKESFIPLSNILTRCAHCCKDFEGEDVLVVVPLVEN